MKRTTIQHAALHAINLLFYIQYLKLFLCSISEKLLTPRSSLATAKEKANTINTPHAIHTFMVTYTKHLELEEILVNNSITVRKTLFRKKFLSAFLLILTQI